MVNPNTEITRLKELMPASARMKIRIILNDRQISVIKAEFPRPWQRSHTVTLNIDLWQHLAPAERDLLFLRTISWVMLANPLKPNGYHLLAGAGVAGGLLELVQGDAVGLLAAGGVAALAGWQVWRGLNGLPMEMAADDRAVQVAQRRGYTQTDAVKALIRALEAVPPLEGRRVLTQAELMRCQNLRSQTRLTEFSSVPTGGPL